MVTRLDAVLLCAWFLSGVLALENRGRADTSGPDRIAGAAPICHLEIAPPHDPRAGFGRPAYSHAGLDVLVPELTLRCDP
jgi:hypothetical protein